MAMNGLQKKFYRLIRATGVFDIGYYLSANPDVARSGIDPIEHYILWGEREGRAPSRFFDPAWYRQQTSKLPEEHNLLAHYLTVGDRDGLQPMPGFDPDHVRGQVGKGQEPALITFLRLRKAGVAVNPNRFFDHLWYLSQYPDVAAARVEPFIHFLQVGADEQRRPSEGFSWYYFRERFNLAGTNSDVFRQLMLRWKLFDLDTTGGEPSVAILQENVRANHRRSQLYQDHAAPSPEALKRPCDVYAFYLTQYHRIPENDQWWGEGFTEWHNVVRGLPRFPGHYQPRTPSALGFYDLTDPAVMPRQVALAKQAGLAGFAFYYYDFGSQRLLEKPLERFLSDPSLDIGYFLIWANETWSRRWDGSDAEILLEQTYPDDLAERMAGDLSRHFDDPRYRRVDGRPLFVIYRVSELPDGFVAQLRAEFGARGHDPLLYMAQTFEDRDPRPFGLDGAMEFPPHKHSRDMRLNLPSRIFVAHPSLRVWSYDDFVAEARKEPPSPFPLIRGCFPSWDNDSRRQGASYIVHGSTPQKFGRWLDMLAHAAERDAEQPPIVCINAWNEWGEGAYLEPDRHFGYAYLNEVQAVLHPSRDTASGRLLLVGHDAFPAGAQRLLLNIARTLKHEFAIEVAFLLLRADRGYDGMLAVYRALADTYVVENNLLATTAMLRERGFSHAIVNSSASAPVLPALADAGIAQVLLVHELPGVLATLRSEPFLREAADKVRRFIVPTSAIASMLHGFGIGEDRTHILPQGQYRPLAPGDRGQAREQLLRGRTVGTLVASLGYGDARKGADLFVAAAEAARAERAPMLFVWQGNWDFATKAQHDERMKRLTAEGYLLHLPDSEDVDTLLHAADVLMLASREDPLPSAAVEAWTVGLPVVALPGAGGVSDFIAADPQLGLLAAEASGEALFAAAGRAAGMEGEEARRRWASHGFNWMAYVRGLLLEVHAPPSIDIAIVGHNHGRFAEERVGSLARQSMPARSISYHDIASADGKAGEAARASAAAGIAFVAEPSNQGRLDRTWARLASASDATFFHLAEGDDVVDPTMIERCVEALERAPGAAFAFVGVTWIDSEGSVIADQGGYPASVIGDDVARGGFITAERLLASDFLVRNPILSISSVLWRREVLVRLLAENEGALARLSFAFDWLLYLRAARAGYAAVFIPDLLCRHRQHEDSFATRGDLSRHAREIATIYQLEPAPGAEQRRSAYLRTLRGSAAAE